MRSVVTFSTFCGLWHHISVLAVLAGAGASSFLASPLACAQAGDLVFFAADSFEASVPPAWQVSEATMGRDVRLVLSPSSYEGNQLPDDCIWVSYTVDEQMRRREIGQLLQQRVRAHSGVELRGESTRRIHVSGHPAVLAEYKEPRPGMALEAGHLLIATPWCLYEVHWSYPGKIAELRRPMIERWLGSVKLGQPQQPARQLPAELASAAEVVGSWKAYRSRMRFFGDGRVLIQMDPPRYTRLNGKPQPKPERLVGTFQGQGDVLYVRWDDGSQLNFRWRVDGDRLLLTDHEGQVSQLRRLLE